MQTMYVSSDLVTVYNNLVADMLLNYSLIQDRPNVSGECIIPVVKILFLFYTQLQLKSISLILIGNFHVFLYFE